ncbi:AAA family ATPase [Candidatus Woesearchaeota archaeon]|nr:AAA family ATPase [Candidatus Woesearchaeota archaeon]
MAFFKDMLGAGESLVRNSMPLNYDFQPKVVPYREKEMRQISFAIKPLFQNRDARNVVVFGPSGVGKTVACKHLLDELAEETDEVIPLYINCWQKNTSFRILAEMCEVLGYKFTQNKRTDELFAVVKQILNKKSAVLVFDEVDKMEEIDFIYTLLEEIYRKSIVLVSNRKEWLEQMDSRIKSRLTPEVLEFKPYNYTETKGILSQRRDAAFVQGIWEDAAFETIARKTSEMQDMRSGLYLMKESANAAEDRSSKKITSDDVKKALTKLDEFTIKTKESLDEDLKAILAIIKEKSGKRIGEIYKSYQEKGGKTAYKTFQRRIAKLEQDKFIETKKIAGGSEGATTIISFAKEKKLTEY